MELPGDILVLFIVSVHVHPVRTQPVGLLDVHGGVDPVFSRLITAGGHHATLRGQRADDERLSFQGRVVPDLYGGKKSVHIHMYDDLFQVFASSRAGFCIGEDYSIRRIARQNSEESDQLGIEY